MGGCPRCSAPQVGRKIVAARPCQLSTDDEFREHTIVARRSSRRLFLATVLFRHAENDVAVAFAAAAEPAQAIDELAI
jgi:hypothetical protein